MTARKQPAPDPQSKARESFKELEARLRRVEKHPSEVEAIHHLRVSIRRFKQVLRVFEDRFPHVRKMRRSLRRLMELCGEVRNWDIAPEVLAAAGTPAGAGLEKRMERRRTRAARDLAKLLKRDDLRSKIHHWRAWLEVKGGDGAVAGKLAPSAREFRSAGAAAARAGVEYAQMHRFRLLVKRYRYTLEILGTNQAQLKILRALQDRLGAINDCVTAADLITEIKVSVAEHRKIKAALNRLLENRSAEFRVYWRAHGRHISVQGSVR